LGGRVRAPGALKLADPVALYIHFPFCLSVCPYCDFVVYGGRAARGPQNRIAAVVDALVTEIVLRGRAARLGSVYIGGGTPSLLTPDQVARLLAAAEAAFGIDDRAEITLEVNPGRADRGDIAGFVTAGVNRVSIGAQSLNPAELRRLGRRHSAADVADTVRLARDAGVSSVSVDLLYDVPGQTISSWCDSLDGTLALEPDHISAYALTVEAHEPSEDHLPVSRGAAAWRARAALQQDEDRAAQMYETLDDRLARAGLRWYEISNWARPGHESRHNLVYWTGGAWEAVGPGAHRYDGMNRSWNSASLDVYVNTLASGRLPPGGSQPAVTADTSVLALRTANGISAHALGSSLAWATDNRLVEKADGERVRLTRRGRLLSNELFARMISDDQQPVAT
jgi:oxygen-independent coproporphyrinogen-3 oxidase